ncbi:hypothetical protein SDC9_201708 [bioreactor metagenome]|uniref:Uncharacterized protein n=1 Tax=bioreactor metagenome TaxID=1076179 RepID=A0A645IUF2_9ZZZZ
MEAGEDNALVVKHRHEVEVGLLPHGSELCDERRRVPPGDILGNIAVPGQKEGDCTGLVLLRRQDALQAVDGLLGLLPGVVLEKA